MSPDGEPATEEERARLHWLAAVCRFFAGLGGDDTQEWVGWIDAMAATAPHPVMLALLQERGGLEPRWAAVLERMWAGGTPPPPRGLQVTAPDLPTPRSLPGAVDSAAADLAPAERQRDVEHAHSPREHAEALVAYVGRHRASLPDPLFWERLRDDVYFAACQEMGWTPRPWNPVAAELARLTGEESPLYVWVRGERRQRLRFYSIALIVAAARPHVRMAA